MANKNIKTITDKNKTQKNKTPQKKAQKITQDNKADKKMPAAAKKQTEEAKEIKEIKKDQTKELKKAAARGEQRSKRLYFTKKEQKEAQNGWAKTYDAKFEKFLVRLPQGTREKFESMGFSSGNEFIKLAVEHEFDRSSDKEPSNSEKDLKLGDFVKIKGIPENKLKERINRLGYDLVDFISEAVKDKLDEEEIKQPPVTENNIKIQDVLREEIIREKKNKKETHEL